MSPDKNSLDDQLIAWLAEQCNPAPCGSGLPCKHYVIEYPLCWSMHAEAIQGQGGLVWDILMTACTNENGHCQTHAYLCTDANGFKIDCSSRQNSVLGSCPGEPIEFPLLLPEVLGQQMDRACFIYNCD